MFYRPPVFLLNLHLITEAKEFRKQKQNNAGPHLYHHLEAMLYSTSIFKSMLPFMILPTLLGPETSRGSSCPGGLFGDFTTLPLALTRRQVSGCEKVTKLLDFPHNLAEGNNPGHREVNRRNRWVPLTMTAQSLMLLFRPCTSFELKVKEMSDFK